MSGIDTLLVVVLVAVFLGAVVNGFAGFGFSAIAGPILIRPLDPLEVVPLMMAFTTITQAIGLFQSRTALSPREVTPFCVGGLVGLLLALPILEMLDPRAFRLIFGTLLLLYGTVALRIPPAPAINTTFTISERLAVGFAGGAIGALTAFPSAAVLVWADRRGYGFQRLRGLFQPYILVIQVAGLLGLWGAGLLDVERLVLPFLMALPALFVGLALGIRLQGHLDARRFRCAILGIVMASGALMVVG